MPRLLPAPTFRLAALMAALPLLLLTACDSSDPGGEMNDPVFGEAERNAGNWTWIDVEGATCRDGSGTGFGLRLQENADDLFIYLQGGGACFSEGTCADNPDSFGEGDFADLVAERGEAGILSTTQETNPVRDWNAVFVPYCTGDVHAGSNPGATPPGAGPQQFVGAQNMTRYVDSLLAPYFADRTPGKVLLTGASAGGFGTLVNFDKVARGFGSSEVYLLDDSGPIFFDNDVLSPTLQGLLAGLWNLEDSFPADAEALTAPDGLQNVYAFYSDKYPRATFGLSSHLQDETIRDFFGVLDPISGEEYKAGLIDLRDRLPDAWGTYYATSDEHTFLGGARFYQSVDGVMLSAWLGTLLDGTATDVAPAEEGEEDSAALSSAAP